MKITAQADDLAQGYEALRAQAVGELPDLTPRGLGVFLRGGLPGWMLACVPTTRGRSSRPAVVAAARTGRLSGVSGELVKVLAGMALASQRGSCA